MAGRDDGSSSSPPSRSSARAAVLKGTAPPTRCRRGNLSLSASLLSLSLSSHALSSFTARIPSPCPAYASACPQVTALPSPRLQPAATAPPP